MALIEWSDRLALGVEPMDDTHREFVEQLNALHLASESEFIPVLDSFIAHTVEHFEQEQRWMSEIDFPPAHCHRHEHDGVLGVMREVRRMVGEGKFAVGKVLTKELAPWFENHAATMDATLAFFLRCIEAGIDPMEEIARESQGARAAASAGSAACGHAARASEATDANSNG